MNGVVVIVGDYSGAPDTTLRNTGNLTGLSDGVAARGASLTVDNQIPSVIRFGLIGIGVDTLGDGCQILNSKRITQNPAVNNSLADEVLASTAGLGALTILRNIAQAQLANAPASPGIGIAGFAESGSLNFQNLAGGDLLANGARRDPSVGDDGTETTILATVTSSTVAAGAGVVDAGLNGIGVAAVTVVPTGGSTLTIGNTESISAGYAGILALTPAIPAAAAAPVGTLNFGSTWKIPSPRINWSFGRT